MKRHNWEQEFREYLAALGIVGVGLERSPAWDDNVYVAIAPDGTRCLTDTQRSPRSEAIAVLYCWEEKGSELARKALQERERRRSGAAA